MSAESRQPSASTPAGTPAASAPAEIAQAAAAVCEVGRRLWQQGLVAGSEGNISVRLSDGTLLVTPTGVSKSFLTPEMLVHLSAAGEPISGHLRPSSEVRMHLAALAARPDVQACVHAHPVHATAFAVAGRAPDATLMPEASVFLGEVALAPYGTPATDEVPAALAPLWAGHHSFLLANHGALTLGSDLWRALYRMEQLEHYCAILLAAAALGGPHPLTAAQLAQLATQRQGA